MKGIPTLMLNILNFQIKILPFVIGVAVAFFGWTLYWLSINITGAAFGGTFGCCLGALISMLFQRMELFLPLTIILGILGVILGIFLIRNIHKFTFFLTGCALGAFAGEPIVRILSGLGVHWFDGLWAEILLKFASAVLGGLVLMRYSRYAVAVFTAAVGSVILVSSWDFKGWIFLVLPIFLCALFVQIYILRKKGKVPSRE